MISVKCLPQVHYKLFLTPQRSDCTAADNSSEIRTVYPVLVHKDGGLGRVTLTTGNCCANHQVRGGNLC